MHAYTLVPEILAISALVAVVINYTWKGLTDKIMPDAKTLAIHRKEKIPGTAVICGGRQVATLSRHRFCSRI
jgi:hypothetical protein